MKKSGQATLQARRTIRGQGAPLPSSMRSPSRRACVDRVAEREGADHDRDRDQRTGSAYSRRGADLAVRGLDESVVRAREIAPVPGRRCKPEAACRSSPPSRREGREDLASATPPGGPTLPRTTVATVAAEAVSGILSKRSRHLRTYIPLGDQSEASSLCGRPPSPFVTRLGRAELPRYRDVPELEDLFVASRHHTDDRGGDQAQTPGRRQCGDPAAHVQLAVDGGRRVLRSPRDVGHAVRPSRRHKFFRSVSVVAAAAPCSTSRRRRRGETPSSARPLVARRIARR
jgi:hypothetical protein